MVFEALLAEVEAIDATALSDDELHELVVAEQRAASRLAAVRARHVAVWEARRAWSEDGSKSAAMRLARDCALAPESARRELRRARKLRSMPVTAAAVSDGRLSVDQADLLGTVCQPATEGLFARDEALLVDQVARMRWPDAMRCVRYWLSQADDELGRPPASLRHDGRHLSAVQTWADTVVVTGVLDPIGGAEFLDELDRLERLQFETDWAKARHEHGDHATADHLERTAPQRRADAVAEMARRSRAMPEHCRPPAPLITVLVGHDAFNHVCELASGTVLSPAHIVPLLADADIERIVFDGPSRVIDVGVRQRFFTGALRRAIEVRDRHCQHPAGCDVPAAQCHIDHIQPYATGGLTTQTNGRCLCPVHNRQRANRPRARARPPNRS